MVEESPIGIHWEVPDFSLDFSDVLSAMARNNEPLLKRGPSEDMAECSPSKRARPLTHGYEGISENARKLTSILAGMSQRLAQLSDPQYFDDLMASQSSASRPDP